MHGPEFLSQIVEPTAPTKRKEGRRNKPDGHAITSTK